MAPPWELRRRGLKDSLRHDQRVKEAIRKNLRELISEEAIITSDGQKTVRIPIRYLLTSHPENAPRMVYWAGEAESETE